MLATNFRTKPKNLSMRLYKEKGMSNRPHVVELAEADDDRCKIQMRFDSGAEAEQMARSLASLLANARLDLDAA